jgi:hypothetical protein
MLGEGDGTFAPAVNHDAAAAGGSPQSVAVGEFNGDGKQDLAVASFSNDVGILLGHYGGSGVGGFDPSTATWYLRNSPNAGAADAGPFAYGAPGWIPVVRDWDGNGTATVGVVDPATATWYLRNSNSPGAPDAGVFQFGMPGWVPVVGEWNAPFAVPNGHTGIGMFDPGTGMWYLRSEASAGPPDVSFLIVNGSFVAGPFAYGAAGWTPVVGDWTGAGHTGIGVFDPSTATWYLRSEVGSGDPDAGSFAYGAPGWKPVVGDWDGNGISTIGVLDPGGLPSQRIVLQLDRPEELGGVTSPTDEASAANIAFFLSNYLFLHFPRGQEVEGAYRGLRRPPLSCQTL